MSIMNPMNTMNIVEIEWQLQEVISSDQKSWVKIYELMKAVEDNALYAPEYRSYTAWVNDFAERANVHVSLLWNRKKAGKFYSDYFERQIKKGNFDVTPLQNLSTSPDNIILVEKIAGKNCSVADELIEKILNGDLKRRDLTNAWQTVKAERAEHGEIVQRKNAHDKPELIEIPEDTDKDKPKQLTAMDIVLAFKRNNWILNRVEKQYVTEKYRIMTEFAVDTGTTRHARRLDILALENISTTNKDDITLHGIEIKVNKNDLLSDKKMAEYTPLCDYFWLAVPKSLIESAKSVISKGWGIIAISESDESEKRDEPDEYLFEVEVIVSAKRCSGIFRDKTITKALLKLL